MEVQGKVRGIDGATTYFMVDQDREFWCRVKDGQVVDSSSELTRDEREVLDEWVRTLV